ncbi:MAG TPA: hypothetical protein PK280_08270 [Planctomycetota bacterium]|nr:hypothetical protein [Planctomycetota bacterium]
MTESDSSESGPGMGAAVVAVAVLVLAAVAAFFIFRTSSSEVPPPPHRDEVKVGTDVAKPVPPPPPPVVKPQVMSTPGKAVVVKLTALGDNGTWFMIDEDICEGDAALTGMLQDRIARDKAARGSPADYSYPVVFEVTAGTGISAAHVAAARKAAEAAGAKVVEKAP